jgi:hypothetical protein
MSELVSSWKLKLVDEVGWCSARIRDLHLPNVAFGNSIDRVPLNFPVYSSVLLFKHDQLLTYTF